MGLLDSVIGAVTGHTSEEGHLAKILSGLLADDSEVGGLHGLVDKFNQAGLGNSSPPGRRA